MFNINIFSAMLIASAVLCLLFKNAEASPAPLFNLLGGGTTILGGK